MPTAPHASDNFNEIKKKNYLNIIKTILDMNRNKIKIWFGYINPF